MTVRLSPRNAGLDLDAEVKVYRRWRGGSMHIKDEAVASMLGARPKSRIVEELDRVLAPTA
jgi:hypothetical protein